MPRTARAPVGGICYRVINCGNARQEVFGKDDDYQPFLKAIAHACSEVPMRILGFCLLTTHFHRAVWPREDADLSLWMQNSCHSRPRPMNREQSGEKPVN